MSDAVLFEQRDKVGIMTINKPKVNQLSHDVFETMRKLLDMFEKDNNVRAMVITGSGDKAFCAGADLSQGFGDFSAVDFLKRGQECWNKVEDYPKPIIAAINGHALGGGCELAMACHIRYMKKGGRIGLTESTLGIMPGYGGTLRLPRIVGRAKALDIMLFGKQLEAEEALKIGLVDKLCEDGKTLDDAVELGKALADRPPLSVKAILKIMSMSASMSPEWHLKVEREELGKLFTSKDAAAGMSAFFSKTKAVFTGE
jgi:enoyl-CoA hydratase/carnithine racemase